MEQPNPYIIGIETIEGYYNSHEVTTKTIKHAHAFELPDEVLHSKISVPGYKYGSPNLYKDFVIEFKHDGEYYKISYSDIALDLYQKMRFNPGVLKPLALLIKDIGIYGDATPIPEELTTLVNNPPVPVLLDFLKKNMVGHRLNSLKFGIPINYYPKILYWLGMNEEINYAPKNNKSWGGRRTAFKRLIETIYIAAKANLRNDKNLDSNDRKNILMVFNRIVRGKNYDLTDFPTPFRRLFAIINLYEHATEP